MGHPRTSQTMLVHPRKTPISRGVCPGQTRVAHSRELTCEAKSRYFNTYAEALGWASRRAEDLFKRFGENPP
jgi:hypothetical protein